MGLVRSLGDLTGMRRWSRSVGDPSVCLGWDIGSSGPWTGTAPPSPTALQALDLRLELAPWFSWASGFQNGTYTIGSVVSGL